MMVGLCFFFVAALWSASLLEKCQIGDFLPDGHLARGDAYIFEIFQEEEK